MRKLFVVVFLLAAVGMFQLTTGAASAGARTLVTGCPPAAGKFKPKRLNVVCSASLASDGYRINLFNIQWETWKPNAASGTAVARYPKPFKYPKLWNKCSGLGTCRPDMVTGPARVELTRPLNCRQGPNVFGIVKVWIDGTSFESDPWTWNYMCPPPRRELLRRGVAVRSTKHALGSYYTFWRKAYSRSVKCSRVARHVMRCRANWLSNATDNGAAVVLDGHARGRVKKGLDGRTYVKLFVHIEPIGAKEDHSASYWIFRTYR